MANKKISVLPEGGPLDGTETVPVVKTGITSKTTTAAIAALAPDTTFDIASLPAAGALGGSEPVPIVQSGVAKRTTTSDIAALGGGGGGGGSVGTSPPLTTTSTGVQGAMEIDTDSGTLWVAVATNKWQAFGGQFRGFQHTTPFSYEVDVAAFSSLVVPSGINLGGDGFEDDWGPALNAASQYILDNGQVGTIIMPNHSISFTGTWLVGDTVGDTATTINLEGAGANVQLVYRGGAVNDCAMWISKNKRGRARNLFLSSGITPGVGCGINIGGSPTGGAATQTTGFHFLMCGFAGFQIQVNDDTLGAGAASEITFEDCWFGGPSTIPVTAGTVGVRPDQFNSTNWTFINCYWGQLERGLDTGGASLITVIGGGASADIIDFYAGGRCRLTIDGFRNEGIPDDGAVIFGNAGQVTARNIRVNNVSSGGDHNVIQGTFRQFALYDSALEGYVSIDPTNNTTITMVGNMLWPNPDTGFPFSWSTLNSGFPGHVFCKNNSYATDVYDQTPSASRIQVPDIEGRMATNDFTDTYLDLVSFIQKQGTPDALFAGNADVDGIDWQGQYHLRCISEAPMPNISNGTSTSGTPSSGMNLRVMGKFASSATCAITFKRTISVTAGSGGITQAGTFFKSDVGKRVFISGGGHGSVADFYGTGAYLAAAGARLGVQVAQNNHLPNFGGSLNAIVGQDEPDANYMVLVTGDTNETFSVSSITSTGFTVTSSNATSTATVTCLIVR